MKRFFLFLLFPVVLSAKVFTSSGGPIVWSLSGYTLTLENPSVTPSSVHPGNWVVNFPVNEDLHSGWQNYSYTLTVDGGGTSTGVFQVNYPTTSHVEEFGPEFAGLIVNSTSGGVGTITIVSGPDAPQGVTISPTSSTINIGASQTFTASGGSTTYVWNLSGGGTTTINAGSCTVTATSLGTYTLSVYAAAESGHAQSNTATASLNFSSHRVSVTMGANTSAYPAYYDVNQDGVLVTTLVQLAGASARIQSVDVPTASAVTIHGYLSGFSYNPSTDTWSSGGSTSLGDVTVTPSPVTSSTATGAAVTAKPVTTTASGVTTPTGSSTSNSSSVVWDGSSTGTAGVTNSVYQQGAGKIVDAINGLKASGDGLNSDAGTHTRLDAANASLTAITVFNAANKTDADTAKTAADSWTTGGGAYNFQTGAQAGFDAAAGTSWSNVTDLAPSQSLAVDTVVVSDITNFTFGDIVTPLATWHMQPFVSFPWLKTALNCIREIFLWGLGIMFYIEAQAKLEKIQFALTLVPQIDTVPDGLTVLGNSAPGVSTAISLAKRLVSAPIIIGTIHIQLAAAIVAMNTSIGTIFGGWSFDSMIHPISHAAATSGGVPFYTALALIDASFPVWAAVEFSVAWILFSWACMVSYGVAASALKVEKI